MNVNRMRILLLSLCLALSCAAYAEGRVCISTQAAAALLSPDGSEVVAPGRYDDIYPVVDGERYALGVHTENGMRYALGDASGRLLSDPVFTMLCESGGEIVFAQETAFGAMSFEGEILVPAEYTQLVVAGDGKYLVMTEDPFDDDADEIYLLEGEELQFTGIRSAEGLTAFADGRTPFQDPNSELFGYLAPDGTAVVKAQFETAGPFVNGVARASKDGKLGLIDPEGEWLVRPEYDFLEVGAKVCVALQGRERFVVFDRAGREMFRLEGAGFEVALVGDFPILMKNGRMLIYNADGKLLLETDRETTVFTGLDGQMILSDGDWGAACVSLADADGTIAERKDQHLVPLADGRYAFAVMDAAGYYSEELEEIRYSCDYESMRFGMMDAQGNEILPAEYLEIRALGWDRFLAIGEEKMIMTDAEGETLWSYAKEE